MKTTTKIIGSVHLAAIIVLSAGFLTTGCNKSNPEGFTEQQQQGMNRQSEILKKAGGDWSKLSPEDKDFLIKGMGSEESAKRYVQHGGVDGHAPAGQYGPPPGKGN
jgi:hypothetical protein